MTGVAFCIATPVGMLTVDRFGRRPILLLGAAGQTVCMCLLGLLFWAGGGETVSSGGFGGWLAVGCVLGFIMSFGISWGIVAWIIPEELMPYKGKLTPRDPVTIQTKTRREAQHFAPSFV